MRPSEILVAARALLVEEGWCQGIWPEGRCAALAIGRAGYVGGSTWAERDVAYDYLKRAIRRRDIVSWNDTEGRKLAEVLAAFDRAIGRAQKAEGWPDAVPGP